MRLARLLVWIAAITALAVTGVVAQHDEHHPEQAAPAADKAKAGKMAEMPQMMMGQMMMRHGEMATLVDKLAKSFAAIEAEKDPAALKTKLAEHGALLKEFQAKFAAQSQMMEKMHGAMPGMMGGGNKNK